MSQINSESLRAELDRVIQEWVNDDNARIGPNRVLIGNDFALLTEVILSAIEAKLPERRHPGTVDSLVNEGWEDYDEAVRNALGLKEE